MSAELVTISIDGRKIEAQSGTPLLNAILNAGLVVATSCGGQGTCHLCRITLERPAPGTPPPNAIESKALGNVLLQQGMRLSCQLPVEAGMQVRLPTIESPSAKRARIAAARARKGRPGER